MSTPASAIPGYEELLDVIWSGYVISYCGTAVQAWIVYEYIITFFDEVRYYWQRKFTGGTLLFMSNRYLLLFYYMVFHYVSDISALNTRPACVGSLYFSQIIQSVQYLPWLAFSALRVYALSEKNWKLAGLVALLAGVPFGITLAPLGMGLTGMIDPVNGCVAHTNISPSTARTFTIISRSCLITADIVVIYVTIVATYRTKVLRKMIETSRRSFADILFDFGILYFVIILTLNILHLTFQVLSIARRSDAPSTYIPFFMQPTTSIVVSRFMLDLQSANKTAVGGSTDDDSSASRIETISFGNRGRGAASSRLSRSFEEYGGTVGWSGRSEQESRGSDDYEMVTVP